MNTVTCLTCRTEVPRHEAHIRTRDFRRVHFCSTCIAVSKRLAAIATAA